MLIRDADPAADAAGCAAIYAPFVRASGVSFEEEAPDACEFATRIAQGLRSYPWLVAQSPHDGVVGFAYGSAHRSRAAYRWAADVAVYVADGFRGRGTGHALYRALLGLLRDHGLQVACAGIALPNDASVALHEACGFRPVGVYRRIGWKAGEWRDVGWWQLELMPVTDGPPPEPGPPLRVVR